MMRHLEELYNLSKGLENMPDDRPEWLKLLSERTEPKELYYRFLYELCKRRYPRPEFVVEIGTYVGVSAAHMAVHAGRVLTIDINPDAAKQVQAIPLKNIEAVTSDSMYFLERLAGYPKADLLFIDGNHTFNQAYGEYRAYRDHVKDDGLILFDDVALPMKTNEMEVFWEFVVDPRTRLDNLHRTGYGVARKDDRIIAPLWKDIIAEATRRFRT
jgi:predicted O-methyltransferase YrrM